jgi:hypothetical protein
METGLHAFLSKAFEDAIFKKQIGTTARASTVIRLKAVSLCLTERFQLVCLTLILIAAQTITDVVMIVLK